jgi:hypothetical protein
MIEKPSYLVPVPSDPEQAPYIPLGRDDLQGRLRAAILEVDDWYRQAEGAGDDEAGFYYGRQLYHVMRPVTALARRLRGEPPESPCTHCGTEEGGACVNIPKPGDSLCRWCAAEIVGY